MKADPGHIAANAALLGARPCLKVEVLWDDVNPVEETNVSGDSRQVGQVNGSSAITRPGEGLLSLGKADLGTVAMQMDNFDGRYSTAHAGSMAATYGIRGKTARVSAGYYYGATAEYVRVFTGRVMGCGEAEVAMTADLELHDMGSVPQQQKLSTMMQTDLRVDQWIALLATAAGVTSTSLERGLCTVPYLYVDQDFALDEMRKAAAAEGGCVFYDADGTLHYWGATHWCNAASVATITVDDWSEVEVSTDWDDEYNVIAVEYQPRTASWPTVVHKLKRVIAVPPGASTTVTLKFDSPLVAFDGYELAANNGAGVDLSSYLTLSSSTPDAAASWTLTFTNAHDRFEAFVTKFDVTGAPLKGRPGETYTTTKYGTAVTRQRDARGSFHVQTETQARMLAELLAQRMKVARPTYTLKGLPGNPLLEMGDVVTITGATRTGITSKTGIIVGVPSWRYGDGVGYRMDLSLMAFADLYAYTGYFLFGTSALGVGRLFV
ncbi:MAG: hypothetical protein ACYC5O_00870 [Anaerolineae bacterium]